jgi:actin-related protein 6
METERFTVPELLFTPSDVDMNQAGVAEACWDGVRQLPLLERAACLQNVLLTGGNANFPNYDKRCVCLCECPLDRQLSQSQKTNPLLLTPSSNRAF